MATRGFNYEEGGAVRKIETFPQIERPRRERERREVERPTPVKKSKTYKKAAKEAQQSAGFDLKYTIVLALMVLAVVVSCVIMLSVQTSVESKEKRIESLQEELQDIQADNDAFENKLDSMYSLEDIYTIATGELGMVYSENGQIRYYENEQGDYVKQYSDVPETAD